MTFYSISKINYVKKLQNCYLTQFLNFLFVTKHIIFTDFSLINSDGNARVNSGERGLLLYKGGTVCDDSFSKSAADAICKEMGYVSARYWTTGKDWEIQEDYEITLDDLQCSSNNWSSCSYSTSHNCEHDGDIFLACTGQYSMFIWR